MKKCINSTIPRIESGTERATIPKDLEHIMNRILVRLIQESEKDEHRRKGATVQGSIKEDRGSKSRDSEIHCRTRGYLEAVLWTILAGGHTLLEGLPGVGKTMLVRSLSDVMDLSFSRIQFTPDLMPTDITGTMVMKQTRDDNHPFIFHKGPLFHHLVLADEINRSTPKTQSALLEAMAEHTVTVVGETMTLEKPFFVLATQNPIDFEGTYPLPEAQVDRFMSKLFVSYPSKQELKQIIKRTTGTEEVKIKEKAKSTGAS